MHKFPPVSKAEWLVEVAKSLKDKPLESLYWPINERITADPFGHADDWSQPPAPLATRPVDWEINENVVVDEAATANAQAREALEFGANSLTFIFEKLPGAAAFERLFEGVFVDMISVHFSGKAVAEAPAHFLALLQNLAGKRGLASSELRGSLDFDLAANSPTPDWRYLADLQVFAAENFPKFKLITLATDPQFSGTSQADAALAELLRRANFYLKNLSEKQGMAPATAAGMLQFRVSVGTSYFVEMAKFRAFNLLWFNVLRGWQVPLHTPVMAAEFSPEGYSDDLYTNMIRATTLAMSAALGGAARLTVLPYDAGREAQATQPANFSRRIARNVQHLLKMESHLVDSADKAAGSFFIEKLTRQLAESAWRLFQNH